MRADLLKFDCCDGEFILWDSFADDLIAKYGDVAGFCTQRDIADQMEFWADTQMQGDCRSKFVKHRFGRWLQQRYNENKLLQASTAGDVNQTLEKLTDRVSSLEATVSHLRKVIEEKF